MNVNDTTRLVEEYCKCFISFLSAGWQHKYIYIITKVMDKHTAVKTIKCSTFQLRKHAHSIRKFSNDKKSIKII